MVGRLSVHLNTHLYLFNCTGSFQLDEALSAVQLSTTASVDGVRFGLKQCPAAVSDRQLSQFGLTVQLYTELFNESSEEDMEMILRVASCVYSRGSICFSLVAW